MDARLWAIRVKNPLLCLCPADLASFASVAAHPMRARRVRDVASPVAPPSSGIKKRTTLSWVAVPPEKRSRSDVGSAAVGAGIAKLARALCQNAVLPNVSYHQCQRGTVRRLAPNNLKSAAIALDATILT